MIAKLFFGRVLPMGAAALLLKSSYSPIQPALAAFGAATNALAGQGADDSGAHFDQAAQDMQGQIQQAQRGGLEGVIHNLFGGGSHPDQAKQQLDAIINNVKNRGELPPEPGDHPRASQPAQAPAKRKGASAAPSSRRKK